MQKLQDSLFKREEKKSGGEKKQYLTDSRARVRFRFNVRLHEDGGPVEVGCWAKNGVTMEECGVNRSSPWQPSILHIQAC